MYIRYQSPTCNHRGLRPGVFGLANSLAHRGLLIHSDWSFWREGNDWFNQAYPDPSAADPSVYDRQLHPQATAWFKETATHLIQRVQPYLQLLHAYGVPCEEVQSHDPGRIIYEDDVQVVVVPHGAAAQGVPGSPTAR